MEDYKEKLNSPTNKEFDSLLDIFNKDIEVYRINLVKLTNKIDLLIGTEPAEDKTEEKKADPVCLLSKLEYIRSNINLLNNNFEQELNRLDAYL